MKRLLVAILCVTTLFADQDVLTIHDRYQKALEAFDHHQWFKVRKHTRAILELSPHNPYLVQLHYLLGRAHYERGDYGLANTSFNRYLEFPASEQNFDEIMDYKFEIAKAYARGHRKRVPGMHLLPKFLSGKTDAVQILDEVISSKARSNIAAEALYVKGNLLTDLHLYKEAVEAFQTLSRRFPKHELAPESFLRINDIYTLRLKNEFIDQDLIGLAESNQERFKRAFPTDPRIHDGDKAIFEMKETLATDLYETGRFFERRKKKDAAKLYYSSVVARFPETNAAKECKKRLTRFS